MALLVKWIPVFLAIMHPVHVSFTNLEYLEEQDKISISFQLFTDDFELLFFHLYEQKLDLSQQESYHQNADKADQYFNQHFTIETEKEKYRLIPHGYKTTGEFTWFYYQINLDNSLPNELKIKHTVLFDLFFDQKNLLIFKWGEIEMGHQFDIRNKEKLILIK
ncbi:MAG: DUF6702 family protein [Bacteroidales bacterium]|jgi:hypothetical protein|nr:DUF6702 family protein [Bacteroidales bacterium]